MAHSTPGAQQRGALLARLAYGGLVSAACRAFAPPAILTVAERERARARQLWERGERMCAWCDQPITTLAAGEELGLALVHHSCAEEFGEWANEDEEAAAEREHGAGARQALADVLAGVPMPDDGEDF